MHTGWLKHGWSTDHSARNFWQSIDNGWHNLYREIRRYAVLHRTTFRRDCAGDCQRQQPIEPEQLIGGARIGHPARELGTCESAARYLLFPHPPLPIAMEKG